MDRCPVNVWVEVVQWLASVSFFSRDGEFWIELHWDLNSLHLYHDFETFHLE